MEGCQQYSSVFFPPWTRPKGLRSLVRFAHNSRRFDCSFHPLSAMASQQILFAETIAGMKKAFKRKSYGTEISLRLSRWRDWQLTIHPTESDSDSEIESYSNRGNKLKKQARFARQGQLVPNNGPSSYKEVRCFDKSSQANF